MDYVKKTLAAPAISWLQYLGQSTFLSLLEKMKYGRLEVVVLPEKKTLFYGHTEGKGNDEEVEPIFAKLTVLDSYFFARLVMSADLGFGEAYLHEEIEIDNITNLIKIFILNRDFMNDLDTGYAFFGHLVAKVGHWFAANEVGKAQDNVSRHYDLSNDLFELFLDPTMMYSSAFWKSNEETLEQAQRNKIQKIIGKLQLQPTDHVLEIGSGWGSMAIEMVKSSGCKVTTITLSKEQLALAEKRIAAGFSDKIEVVLRDYREMQGTFDKIVSIEMAEQVGHEFLGTYFHCIDKLLKPHGIAVIQVITFPDQRYAEYVKGCDFIQKYIFPGTCLPSITALLNSMTNHSSLILEDLENIGPHYARTLRFWHDNFVSKKKQLEKLGFDEYFQRMWRYYFCYCEAGFATRTLGDVQIVLTRPCNTKTLSKGIPS